MQKTDVAPAVPGGPGLRERKKAACRSALIDAAQAIAADRGVEAVTVEEVCERAGVSARTFFNYFDTKDDAVLGHVPWPLDPAVAEAFAAGGPTGVLPHDVVHLLTRVLDGVPDRDRMMRGLSLARQEPRLLSRHLAWLDQHKDALLEMVRRRLGPDDERSDVATMLVLLLVHTAIERRDRAGGDGSPGDHLGPALRDLRSLISA
ncbi:TetR/AcrR family transcriptional regulator [Cellulomonas marina]|uniref:DNA-binding transcriptional regulator, AcrR family n=1 Tax=Cellulomonas marina TaxID=988821 RepID=A0A1I0VFF2_9CELL|nr:TetR/AcrR family transcriptional regulator [Cellulomonas marina]SFA74326.1 DNA-binding transcriptional regulator, AcrR family [Cellulomonas marina]